METSDLVKAIMEEVESQKVKFNKLKDDLRLSKENQSKQNDTFRANISKIIEDLYTPLIVFLQFPNKCKI